MGCKGQGVYFYVLLVESYALTFKNRYVICTKSYDKKIVHTEISVCTILNQTVNYAATAGATRATGKDSPAARSRGKL